MTVLNVVSGTPETGLWCARCLLPSVIKVALFVLEEDGPRQIGTHTDCRDCERAK